MKAPAPVLCFAGSDPSGGAGLQVDLLTCRALGARAATVVTAITAQGVGGVRAVEAVGRELLGAQLDALLGLGPWPAVKVGLLVDEETIRFVAEGLATRLSDAFVVVDPVLAASSGKAFASAAVRRTLLEELVPRADLITPNLPEAALLLERSPEEVREDPSAACAELLARGAKAVLLKGGHASGERCTDLLVDGIRTRTFEAGRIETRNDRGTGCTLSSAIASLMARGAALEVAVAGAKSYVTAALLQARDWPTRGERGPLGHECPLPRDLEEISRALDEEVRRRADRRGGSAS